MCRLIKLPVLLILVATATLAPSCDMTEAREYYEMKFYSYESESQELRLDNYLELAYLPALHRAGIENVGVFKHKQTGNQISNEIIVLVPFTSMGEYLKLSELLKADELYLEAGRDYIEAPHNDPPYSRISSILLKSFSTSPQLVIPPQDAPREERVYELRSYQSATELLYERKVDMFNSGETALFERLGFHPVFFGEVISSSHMPHLMYMTTFADTTAQKKLWEAFGQDPEWQEMKEIELYKNTVSNIDKYLLYPSPYSDY